MYYSATFDRVPREKLDFQSTMYITEKESVSRCQLFSLDKLVQARLIFEEVRRVYRVPTGAVLYIYITRASVAQAAAACM